MGDIVRCTGWRVLCASKGVFGRAICHWERVWEQTLFSCHEAWLDAM